MKRITLLIFLFIGITAFSQTEDFELIRKINGIEVYYKMTKTKEAKKRDTWVIEFEYINNSDSDIFYKSRFVSSSVAEQLLGNNSPEEVTHFSVISLENVKGINFISDRNINLRGDRTRLKTDRKESIYIMKKGKIYTRTMDFRAKKDVEPVIVVKTANNISFTGSVYDFM